jgi:hypothetical protein
MKTLLRPSVLAFIMILAVTSCGQQPAKTTTLSGAEERERVAADIASNLAKNDYTAVRKDFAKIMLDAISVEKIKDNWESLTAKIGEYQNVVSTKESQLNGYNVIKKRCQFASENATIQVTFNEENKVIGMYLKL